MKRVCVEERIKHLTVALRVINRDLWEWQEQVEGRHGYIALESISKAEPIRDDIESRLKGLLSQADSEVK